MGNINTGVKSNFHTCFHILVNINKVFISVYTVIKNMPAITIVEPIIFLPDFVFQSILFPHRAMK